MVVSREQGAGSMGNLSACCNVIDCSCANNELAARHYLLKAFTSNYQKTVQAASPAPPPTCVGPSLLLL